MDQQRDATAYQPWLVASLAWVLGLVAQTGATLVLGYAGLVTGFLVVTSVDSSDLTVVVIIGTVVLVGSLAAAIVVMAWFIGRRGGQRAWLASSAVTLGSWAVGVATRSLTLPFLAQVAITGVLSIVVLAWLTRPQD